MSFTSTFNTICNKRRTIELVKRLAGWCARLLLAWFAYGMADLVFQLGATTRLIVSIALAVLFVLDLCRVFARSLSLAQTRIAKEVDVERHDARQTALCSLNLSTDKLLHGKDSTTGWLKEQSLAHAAEALSPFSWRKSRLMRRVLRRMGAVYLPMALPLLVVLFFFPTVFNISCYERLISPLGDTPPWTPMQFAISPDPAHVVYGDNLLVKAELSGAQATGDVSMLVRNPGLPIQKLSTYREGKSGYSRRLEKMTANCEIAFETTTKWGKAQSKWHPVTVILQPKIVSGEIIVHAPSYMKQKKITLPLSGQEIPVREGGIVEFRFDSNRALAKATATFIPIREELPQKAFEGEMASPTKAVFRIPVRNSGNIRFQVTDYDGIQMERPLENKVKVTVDQRPVIRLISPQPIVVAPPDALLPLQMEAIDDHELIRVDLFKQVNDSKERSTPYLEDKGSNTCLVNEQIPLALLGAKPGDTLTFYLEARDSNPYALNITTGDSVKIFVLSDEECLELLRMQTSVKTFLDQYEVLLETYNNTVKALDEAIENNDAEQAEKLLERVKDASHALNLAAATLSENTPAFETDHALKALSDIINQKLAQNNADLEKAKALPNGSAEQKELLRQMRARLQEEQEAVELQQREARDIASIASVYEKLMEIRDLLQRQKEIVDALKHYEEELLNNRRVTREQLQSIGEDQREVAQQLDAAINEFPALLEKMPEGEDKTRARINALIAGYHELKIQDSMKYAREYCQSGQHLRAGENASKAYASLKKLLENEGTCDANQFCEGLSCQNLSDVARKALEQMIQAMCNKQGSGENGGQGSGYGPGFSSGDGSFNKGMNVMGSKRVPLQPARQSRGQGDGQGQGTPKDTKSGAPGSDTVINRNEERSTPQSGDSESGQSMGGQNIREIPPAYRDAVKQYFDAIKQQ